MAAFEVEALQVRYRSATAIGIGLERREMGLPLYPLKHIYQKTGQLDIRRTAHPGEEISTHSEYSE